MKKKISFASSLMVSGALILAACNTPIPSGTNGAGVPQTDFTPQSTLDLTSQPGIDDLNNTATPNTPSLFSTSTPDGQGSGSLATGTPEAVRGTVDPTATQVSTTGNDTQNSAQAGVESGLVRLSNIMIASVQNQANEQAGQVQGALLTGPAIGGAAGENPAVNVEGPFVSYLAVDVVADMESGAVQKTNEANTESSQAAANEAYRESWSQLAGQNDLVLVPWQVFNFNENVGSTGSANIRSNLDITALSTAPHFSAANPPDFGAANWNTTIDQYWASQGTSIPVTGTNGSQIGQPVLLTAPFTGINVSLGDGQTVAQVQDFLVNPISGQIEYVLLSSAAFGEGFVPVPAGAMNWNQVTTLDAESGLNVPNDFTIDVSNEMFNQAPLLENLGNLDVNSDTWRQNVDQYWQDFLNTGSEKVK